MDDVLFNELIESCHEAIEHKNGNIKLRSHTVTIDDDIINKYNQLSKDNQQTVKMLIDRLLLINNGASVIK